MIDASATSAWLIDDERDHLALETLASVRQRGAYVPLHWRFEVANSLLMAERRRRSRPGRAKLHVRSLAELPIRIDDASDVDATFDLASAHNLTFYDALYLELALRRQLPLATRDRALARAALAAGVAFGSD